VLIIPKLKTKYICQNCGNVSHQWLGKCPDCNSWNSFVEDVYEEEAVIKTKIIAKDTDGSEPQLLSDIQVKAKPDYISSGISEVDRVFGGGIVPGEVILLGGDPGIGKSTLSLQIAGGVDNTLYISGEESIEQLKLRADRLETTGKVFLLNGINVKEIEKNIKKMKPALVILDSVQTIYHPEIPSAPGSVSQVREGAAYLIRTAKSLNVPLLIIGHITKDGSIAGPKILEHLVDAVLYFEGDKRQDFRILRAVKNRYGAIDEIGVFYMRVQGLQEVEDFSSLFVNSEHYNLPGTVVTSSIEGSRSFLVEIQALTTSSAYSMPKRVINGVDSNKVAIIAAVIEKKLGMTLSRSDLFINIVGGLKISEPAIDLAVVLAIISSFREEAFQAAAIGELGLSGEIRPVPQVDKRIAEIKQMGIDKIFIPKSNNYNNTDEQVIAVSNIEELVAQLY
jgi:DNA repair protein RadA/Sms